MDLLFLRFRWNKQTNRQTDKTTTVTLTCYARRGLMNTTTDLEESLQSGHAVIIGGAVGGCVGAVIIVALVIMVVIVVIMCRHYSQKKKAQRCTEMQDMSNPSPENSSSEAILRIYHNKEKHTAVFRNNSTPATGHPQVASNSYQAVQPLNQPLIAHPKNLLLHQSSVKMMNRISASIIRELTSNMLIPYTSLNLMDCVGQGEFGVVYKAEYTEPEGEMLTVAVKTMKGCFDNEQVNKIMSESLKMKHFDHPNVLHLIGVCLDGGSAPFIVMPFMANGSLLHYLKKERSKILLPPDGEIDDDLKIDVRKRLTVMCLQIAKGMEYLAQERFVHRDLATRNCMIDIHFVIKIADFGLTEDVYSKNYFKQTASKDSHVKLPIKWMAPESLTDGLFSEKTDVWSFGVTCWEIFSGGKTPYAGMDPLLLSEMLETNRRLKKPLNVACSNEMYALMMTTWAKEPHDRPTFSSLVTTISDYTETIAGYLDVNFNPFYSQKSDLLSVLGPLSDSGSKELMEEKESAVANPIPPGALVQSQESDDIQRLLEAPSSEVENVS